MPIQETGGCGQSTPAGQRGTPTALHPPLHSRTCTAKCKCMCTWYALLHLIPGKQKEHHSVKPLRRAELFARPVITHPSTMKEKFSLSVGDNQTANQYKVSGDIWNDAILPPLPLGKNKKTKNLTLVGNRLLHPKRRAKRLE
uniref:Uncharacterized protein n=1 Tax=Trypanosoma congolense (strain IL3000) TaxID=1068625 RepID=G0UUZ2_TRYCI|nr:hypothetical protein, unlikely [Trypanosoma congolense IL3000]